MKSVVATSSFASCDRLWFGSGLGSQANGKQVGCMGNPAARMSDMVLQAMPHCHAPIHPAAPVPTPVPHPALPLAIIKGQPTVLIAGKPAARVTDTTAPCMLPGCVPGGPGVITAGSVTVMIGGMPAARLNDMTSHASCIAPIPSPVGKILPPCCPTVMIG